jgi:hypothetical protein
MASENIKSALRNQKAIIKELFQPHEINTIRAYSRALEAASFKDPNPSGTATAIRALTRNTNDGALKTLLQTQSKRELFSKHNVIMSRIYAILAKKVPASFFGSKEGAARKLAERAISQDLTPAPRPSFGGLGGAIGNELTNDIRGRNNRQGP